MDCVRVVLCSCCRYVCLWYTTVALCTKGSILSKYTVLRKIVLSLRSRISPRNSDSVYNFGKSKLVFSNLQYYYKKMFSSVLIQSVSCMMVAVCGLELTPSLWSQQKRNSTITVVPQPAAGYAIDRSSQNEIDGDEDDDDVCVICQSPLSQDTVPTLRHSPNGRNEKTWDDCCQVVEIKEITRFPESSDLQPWNVRLSCGHVYHRQCINKWYEKKFTCPLCNSYEVDISYELLICKRVVKRY